MSDDLLDAESSTDGSSPRELFTITRSDGVTYRHTSGSRDIVYLGQTFTAIAIDRGPVKVTRPDDQEGDMDLILPVDHQLVQRWVAQATPPKSVTCTVQRMNGSAIEPIWTGSITGLSIEENTAKFRLAPVAGEWALRVIPLRTISRRCPYAVYDGLCRVDRNGNNGGLAFKVSTTIMAIEGRTVTVDLLSTARNGSWAAFGEVVHSNGERMSVLQQTDLVPGGSGVCQLELQAPIVGAKNGDSVTVYAGCDWALSTCRDRFANVANFGGLPYLETDPPALVALFGIRKES